MDPLKRVKLALALFVVGLGAMYAMMVAHAGTVHDRWAKMEASERRIFILGFVFTGWSVGAILNYVIVRKRLAAQQGDARNSGMLP